MRRTGARVCRGEAAAPAAPAGVTAPAAVRLRHARPAVAVERRQRAGRQHAPPGAGRRAGAAERLDRGGVYGLRTLEGVRRVGTISAAARTHDTRSQ
jgi:hypothetical protein